MLRTVDEVAEVFVVLVLVEEVDIVVLVVWGYMVVKGWCMRCADWIG